jgi:succinate dehydrogenase/fumarate reductase flavoprotein subunit
MREIKRIEENAVPQLYALDPHKLMRSLEDLSMIEHAKIIINAMKERKFTNPQLGIERVDYPKNDEEDANNYLTMHLENDEIKFARVPVRYWGNMKEQYEAHNQDYTGVYKKEN